jgi:hypothetical protein
MIIFIFLSVTSISGYNFIFLLMFELAPAYIIALLDVIIPLQHYHIDPSEISEIFLI